jgi:hypothetical protein
MLSECKGNFKDVVMFHKIDELLHTVGLSVDIDAISDSVGDLEVLPTLQSYHCSYETPTSLASLTS